MAEIMAAFSLAANIIQFIDIGTRLTTKFWSSLIRRSRESESDLKKITKDLQMVSSTLMPSAQSAYENGNGLRQLATNCHSAANELLGVLTKLNKFKSMASKIEAVEEASRYIYNGDEKNSLKARLSEFSSELTLHLLASLRLVVQPFYKLSSRLTYRFQVFKARKQLNSRSRCFSVSQPYRIAPPGSKNRPEDLRV